MQERSKWTAIAWVAVAAALAVAALRGLSGGAGAPPPVSIDRAAPRASRAAGGEGLYVHVAGAVKRPGLYTVPEGSRVAAAIRRAGGTTRRAAPIGVNLAARVEDGQQIVVPQAGPSGTAGGASGAGPPSLSTATVEQLDELDGIGPALAKRIVDFRTKNGGFSSVEQLAEVEGIGDKRLKALKEALAP